MLYVDNKKPVKKIPITKNDEIHLESLKLTDSFLSPRNNNNNNNNVINNNNNINLNETTPRIQTLYDFHPIENNSIIRHTNFEELKSSRFNNPFLSMKPTYDNTN